MNFFLSPLIRNVNLTSVNRLFVTKVILSSTSKVNLANSCSHGGL